MSSASGIQTMRPTIRSGVVSSNIEVELAGDDIVQVQLRGQDSFPSPQRARERLTKRVDDHTTAADHDIRRRPLSVVRYGMAIGIVLFFGILASREHEAAAFNSNVVNGVLPLGVRVDGRCTVDLGPLGVVEIAY